MSGTVVTATKRGTVTCAFVGDDGCCSVYDRRPFVCRLFGTSDDHRLRCPHGCGPKRKLTKAQSDARTEEYMAVAPDLRAVAVTWTAIAEQAKGKQS